MAVELLDAGFSSTNQNGKTDYVLQTQYTANDDITDVKLSLYRTDKQDQLLAVTSFSAPVDYDFEGKLASAVKNLLITGELQSNAGSDTLIRGLITANDTELFLPEKKPAFSIPDITIGLGAVFFLGSMTDYSQYGETGYFRVGSRLPLGKWNFSPGFRLLVFRTKLDSKFSDNALWVTTAGVDCIVSTPRLGRFRFAGIVSGGPAFLTFSGKDGTLSKTDFFADAGLSVRYIFKKGIYAGAQVRYVAIVDTDMYISGILPMISVGKEL